MNRQAAVESVSFLSRAESRVCLMESLLDDGPLDQRAVQQRLDYSRSQITRSLESLTEVGWVTATPDGYQLTPVGRLIISDFCELLATVETAESLAPFLEWFPLSSYDISLAELRSGEVTVAAAKDPVAPIRELTALLRSATQFRALVPSIDIETVRVVHDRIADGELVAEIVVPPAFAEIALEEPFAPYFEELLASGRHPTYVTPEIPLYLGIADDTTVQIGVLDDEGIPRALLETTNESVRSWADTLFSRYRQSAVDQLTIN